MATNDVGNSRKLTCFSGITIRKARFPQDKFATQHLLRQYAASLPATIQEIIREEEYFDEVANADKIWESSEQRVFLLAFDSESGEAVGRAALGPLQVGTESSVAPIIKANDKPFWGKFVRVETFLHCTKDSWKGRWQNAIEIYREICARAEIWRDETWYIGQPCCSDQGVWKRWIWAVCTWLRLITPWDNIL